MGRSEDGELLAEAPVDEEPEGQELEAEPAEGAELELEGAELEAEPAEDDGLEAEAEAPEAEAEAEAPEAEAPEEPGEELAMEAVEEEGQKIKPQATLRAAPPKKIFDAEWTAEVPEDARPRVAQAPRVPPEDANLGLIVQDSLLSSLGGPGFDLLFGGGRATVGVHAGRYCFEVTVVDATPRSGLRIGWGTADAAYVCGGDAKSIAYGEDGSFWSNLAVLRKGQPIHHRAGDVLCISLNLDSGLEKHNTVSVFRNGARIAPPVALPEPLQGKTLFPMVAIRGATVSVNFGTPGQRPIRELPFQARLLGDAAAADATTVQVASPATCEVVLPVGLPGEGLGAFLDTTFYPRSARKYLEISERAAVKWAEQSCLRRAKNTTGLSAFNQRDLDRNFVRSMLVVAGSRRRDCVLFPEVRANLLPAERAVTLAHFRGPHCVRRAVVAVGEPGEAFVEHAQEAVLDKLRKKKHAEVAQRKFQFQAQRRVREQKYEREKRTAQVKREQAEKRAAKEGKEPEEVPDPDEPVHEEEPDWEQLAAVDASEVADVKFPPQDGPDVPADLLAREFEQYALPAAGPRGARVDPRWLPEGQEAPEPGAGEGFDEVEFAWNAEEEAREHLAGWQRKHKLGERVPNFKPGPYIKEMLEEWSRVKLSWRKKAREFNAEKKQKKAENEKKKAAAATEAAKVEAKAEDEEAKDEPAEEEVKEEPADADLEEEEQEVDPWAVESIDDHDGKGTPLYEHFSMEDWLLLHTRFEFVAVLKAFQRDVTQGDPERKGIAFSLFPFYYQAYFQKAHDHREGGFKDFASLVKYLGDTVKVNPETEVLELVRGADEPPQTLVRVVEVARRERMNRIAAGDESATIHLGKPRSAETPRRTPSAPLRVAPLPAKGKGKSFNAPQRLAPKGFGKGAVRPMAPVGRPAMAAQLRPMQQRAIISPSPQLRPNPRVHQPQPMAHRPGPAGQKRPFHTISAPAPMQSYGHAAKRGRALPPTPAPALRHPSNTYPQQNRFGNANHGGGGYRGGGGNFRR